MRSPIHRLTDRVVSLFGYGLLKVVDDSGLQQVAQFNLNPGGPVEEVIDRVLRLGEYGFYSCPPPGAEGVAVFMGGRRTSGVIVATGYKAARPKGLAPGEAMLFNALAQQFIVASADGKFRSQAPDWLHDGDYHVSGTSFAAHMIPADGWTGTFATGDGRTVTVTHGIITNVA